MSHRWLTNPKFFILTPLVLLLLALAACGGTAAEPIVVEKEVIKEIIKEVPIEKRDYQRGTRNQDCGKRGH